MAGKYTAPTMDWSSPGDVHRRFQIFKQKCELIFLGPLAEQDEAYKVRMLLLWSDEKGLEIYNTAALTEEDKLKLKPVWQKFATYVTPRSNHILARVQLRALKQENLTLEEFITRARTLTNDCGYPADYREITLQDTLVFGLKSDKVRSDAIAIGNTLTYQQVYDLAKTEESTTAQMGAIATVSQSIHALQSKPAPRSYSRSNDSRNNDKPRKYGASKQSGGSSCFGCGGSHAKGKENCPAKDVKCHYCQRNGHYQRVCLQKQRNVSELAYHNLAEDNTDNPYTMNDIGSITARTIDALTTSRSASSGRHIDKIFAGVKLNDSYKARLKVDTGSNRCTLTTQDLKKSQLDLAIQPDSHILNNYGGGTITSHGSTQLKLSYNGKSTLAHFSIVEAPDNPSILGCRQALELGILTLNINSIHTSNETQPAAVVPTKTHDGSLTKEHVLQEYQDCFDKIGRFPGDKYKIKLIEDPKPVVHAPRTVPVHILPLYKAELDAMLIDEIISPVTEPTDWVNSIVCNVTETDAGKKIRLCLDPKDLNKNIRREHYYSRTIDEILPQLHNKKYFTVADTKKGYWHVELDHESSLLCTFNTPFGRFKFNRLPFGINVSQDAFQRRLDDVYKGIKNVCGIADDIIACGQTPEEHDLAVLQMLEATRKNNISLNSKKLQFKQPTVNFFGIVITDKGIRPQENKLQAIKNLKPPENVKELLSILGMITYLNRFSKKLAELTAPLRELTKKGIHFHWEQRHDKALEDIKNELCEAQLLSFYDPDPRTKTILQCDASQLGLGAWLRQIDQHGNEKIVAMTSGSLTGAETRYSNIERECLAVKFGLKKFEYYLMGRHTIVESDHSPLEQIFKKNIAEVPTRLQNLILWCLRFDVTVVYKPGIKIPVADALSRVCLPPAETGQREQGHEVHFVTGLSTPININRIKEESLKDSTLNLLKDIVFKGWPDQRKRCPQELWEFWNFRCDLIIDDGLVLRGDRILIPKILRKQVLEAIHTAHQGETKCILLAKESVFWPGITNDIRDMIHRCSECSKYQPAPAKLPIMQPDLPTRPWEKLGTDIFEYNKIKYLIIVDYYSRYMVIRRLPDIKAETICNKFTNVLTEFGMPSTIIADFGTQYTSEVFKRHCKDVAIEIRYSSPYHHQANSVAERAIGTIKHLWNKACENKQTMTTALWMYRITPLDNVLPSPYELLFNRKPQTFLPKSNTFTPGHVNTDQHIEQNQTRQEDQAKYYNKRASHDTPPLNPGESVVIYNTLKKVWEPGEVVKQVQDLPRTYIVRKENKEYQRTREHLKLHSLPKPPAPKDPPMPATPQSSDATQAPDVLQIPDATPTNEPQPETPGDEPKTQSSDNVGTRSGRTVRIPGQYKE